MKYSNNFSHSLHPQLIGINKAEEEIKPRHIIDPNLNSKAALGTCTTASTLCQRVPDSVFFCKPWHRD